MPSWKSSVAVQRGWPSPGSRRSRPARPRRGPSGRWRWCARRPSGEHCSSSRPSATARATCSARLDDLLHETDRQRLGGAELVGAQQVVHGVAPSAALHVADRRAAERCETALGLELAEAGVGGGDDDVAGQGDLDADRERDPLHRGDQRLAQPPAEPERVDRASRPVGDRRPVRRRCRRTAASRVRRSCARRRTSARPTNSSGSSSRRVRAAPSSSDDLRREGVLLRDPVDGHHQDVVVDDLAADLAVRVWLLVRIGSMMERTVRESVP